MTEAIATPRIPRPRCLKKAKEEEEEHDGRQRHSEDKEHLKASAIRAWPMASQRATATSP